MTQHYLPLGCYGKLPIHTEYLEENLTYPTAREFKRWMHDGRSAAHVLSGNHRLDRPDDVDPLPDAAEAPRETLWRRFLFSTPGSVDVMAGVVRPSTDQGQLRRFPFTVFTNFPRRLYGRHYAMLPMALATVWDALDAAWDNLAVVTGRGAFQEIVRSTRIPAPADPNDARADYRYMQSESSGRIFRHQTDASLAALSRNIPGILKDLKSHPESVRLELPVSSELETACHDLAFWLDLFNHQFLLKRFEPSLFLDETPGIVARKALMYFGPVILEDYPVVLGVGAASHPISRPAHEVEAARAGALDPAPGPTFAELVAQRFVA